MTRFLMFISLLILLCLVIAGAQNNLPLDVKFVGWILQMSLRAVVLWAAVGGAAMVGILSLPILAKKTFQMKRLQKDMQRLEGPGKESGQEGTV